VQVELEILGLSNSQAQTGSFALILGEVNGKRRLPIIIGMFEAQAIAIEIEKIRPNRPMTHDLFRSLAEAFDISVQKVIISDLREGVFYAQLICERDGQMEVIDARPSDAIAIAIRFDAPIFAEESVMDEAGIVIHDESEESMEEVAAGQRSESFEEQLKHTPTDQLQKMLEEALEKEDYERAAKIRDELNRRN
jgi:bifunctional DNase/RNase